MKFLIPVVLLFSTVTALAADHKFCGYLVQAADAPLRLDNGGVPSGFAIDHQVVLSKEASIPVFAVDKDKEKSQIFACACVDGTAATYRAKNGSWDYRFTGIQKLEIYQMEKCKDPEFFQ